MFSLSTHVEHIRLYTGLIAQWAPSLDDLLNDPRFANQTEALSDEDKQRLRDNPGFTTDGSGYFVEQATRVSTKHLMTSFVLLKYRDLWIACDGWTSTL